MVEKQKLTFNLFSCLQLCLTLMMMTIIVYIYTVLAFNFFRKFYTSEGEDGEAEQKCHNMATVSS